MIESKHHKMIVTEVSKNINTHPSPKAIDYVYLEWFETTKRIQRLSTEKGLDIAVRLLGTNYILADGTILSENDNTIIVVSIKPCKAIQVDLQSTLDIAFISHEMGNKHAPLFIEDTKLVMPFENALFQWLVKNHFQPIQVTTKLLNPLNANIDPKLYSSKKGPTNKIPLFLKS